MPNPFVRRLHGLIDFTQAEADALAQLMAGRVRTLATGEDLAVQGEPSNGVTVFLTGWAVRAKVLPDGRRQIIAFFLPGDVCGFGNDLFRIMDHMVSALTPVTLIDIDPSQLASVIEEHPRIGRAFRWDRAVSASIQREWTVNLGQRTAFERFGHLFCELLLRLKAAGVADDEHFELPLTQTDLADATGVSTVHANRILQELRQAGLIRLQSGTVEILDYSRLVRLSLFDPSYLHLDGWRPDSGTEPPE